MNTADIQTRDIIHRHLVKSNKITIISHVNPDGDAIGASLALYHYMRRMGKEAITVMPNQYPDFLKWLPGSEGVIIFSRSKLSAETAIHGSDLIFLLDFNTPGRSGKAEEAIMNSGAVKVMIDHHPGPADFADAVFSDPRASSTAELVFRLIELSGDLELIDNVIASCLYAGIMSDTGSFSYNSSNPETYRVMAELLKKGIDKDYIYSMVYDNFSESRLRLLGYCLDRKMVVLPQYKTAYMSLSLEEKRMYNYIRGDSEGFVNYPLSVKGVDLAAFFMENDDHVKVSFRSRGTLDVNDFAEKNFNGGGHVNASGGESKLSLPETINKFVSLLPEYMA